MRPSYLGNSAIPGTGNFRRLLRNLRRASEVEMTAVKERSKIKPSLKGLSVTRPRTKEPNLKDPRGQLGSFLRHWIDKHHAGDTKRIADALEVSPRAVTKWCEGESAPDLFKLDLLAKEMGFADWTKLAAAVHRHLND